ncbi:MAG: hypothetical protein WBA67_07595, partial [Jannaschia sp.]
MPKHAIAAGTAFVLCAGPALADLTAQQIWTDWQQVYAAMGTTVTAESETFSNGVLSLTGVTTSAVLGDIESRSNFGSLSLVEQGDGTVRIDLPPSMTLETVTEGSGETLRQSVVMETTGWSAIVSEAGEGRVYDISADELSYVFTDISGGEEATPVGGRLSLAGIDSTATSTPDGDRLALDQTLTADGMTLTVAATGDSAFDLSYVLAGLASRGVGTLDLANIPSATSLSAMGLLFAGDLEHSGSTIAMTVESESGPVAVNGTSGAGRIAFDIGADTLAYTLSSTDAQLAVQLASFPVPLNLSMAEVTSGFTLPVGVSDTPKPFGLSLAYREIAVDDALWSLFDPTGQLPRDPATILLDLSGTALMLVDLFGGDPEAIASAGAPGELKTMDLNQLQVSLAGA